MNTVQEQIRWLELQANTWKYCPAAERAKFDAIKESLKSMQARIEVLEKALRHPDCHYLHITDAGHCSPGCAACEALKETP
jgi:hypothetical protein